MHSHVPKSDARLEIFPACYLSAAHIYLRHLQIEAESILPPKGSPTPTAFTRVVPSLPKVLYCVQSQTPCLDSVKRQQQAIQ
jgi:hypothetical protein